MDDTLDTSDYSNSSFDDTSDYSDSTDIGVIMDDVSVESAEDFSDAEMNMDFSEDSSVDENISDIMENGFEDEPSENLNVATDIVDIMDEAILDEGENLFNETDTQVDDALEDNGFQRTLKRDELDLLKTINTDVNNTLEVKADDYRDKGFTEDEIAIKLEEDKIEFQREYLNDAFPNQNVSPEVFLGFEEYKNEVSSIDNDLNAILDGDVTDDTDISNINDEINIQSDTDTLDTSTIQDNMTQDITESEDVYNATPISEIQIVQEDGSIDTIENIMNDLNADGGSSEVANDISLDEAHYTTPSDEIAETEPLENIESWVKDINSNFDEFDTNSPYSNNCGSCAYAVNQRLEGNPDICASAENIGYNDEMEALTGMEQVSMSPEEIEQRLLNEGNGAHAIIGIDRAEGAGHWFNAACIDGKVVAIDGQSGSISGWPPDYGDVVNWEMSVRKEISNG